MFKVGLSFHLNSFSAMIQQPRVPSSGLMPASDVLIRAKEVGTNSFQFVLLEFQFDGIGSFQYE